MMQQAFGAYRAVVAGLSEDDRFRAWAAVRDYLARFEGASGFEADLEMLIGAGALSGFRTFDVEKAETQQTMHAAAEH